MTIIHEEKKPGEDGRGEFTALEGGQKGGQTSCCTMEACLSFLKKWWWVFLIIVVVIIVIVLCAIFIPRKSKQTESTTPTTEVPVTPYPGYTLTGAAITLDNYTASLQDETSARYKMFTRNFTDAVKNSYAGTPYESFLEAVIVTGYGQDGLQVEVQFEIRLTELDNDNQLPDAHTSLEAQLSSRRLGRFLIKSFRIIVVPPS